MIEAIVLLLFGIAGAGIFFWLAVRTREPFDGDCDSEDWHEV